MKLFSKNLKKLLCFCFLAAFAGTLFACTPKQEVEINISATPTLSVEVGQSKQLEFAVNPKQALVSFSLENNQIASLQKENSQMFVCGLSEGNCKLEISVMLGQKKNSTFVEIVVVKADALKPGEGEGTTEKPSLPEQKPDEVETSNPDNENGSAQDTEKPEQKPDENLPEEQPEILDAENRISAECEFGGIVKEDKLFVYKSNAAFVFVLQQDFNVDCWKLTLVADERKIDLQVADLYVFPYLQVEECFLQIEVTQSLTGQKFSKVFSVIFAFN